ncbi:arginine--tRNA ligase [Actinomycetaceae bacterium MB13-C1-2]|nr:arginine--tRNA ligase [Actinomycetaceae bacterium MB13-C1-2]
MTPQELSTLVRMILVSMAETGEVELDIAQIPEEVTIERPRVREHGDWSTNVAMQLGKKAGMAPRDFAELLAKRLRENPGVQEVDIAGPGFVNIRLDTAAAGEIVGKIIEDGGDYGRGESLAGQTINLEYVSANPTGPVHLGGARWAAFGDALARVLAASGASVVREYYFNDHGSQIDKFAKSLLARARGEEVPEDGYGGQYIEEIAQQVTDVNLEGGLPAPATLPDAEALEAFRSGGVEIMFDEIKQKLHDFRVDFDVFFHEESLHESGAVDRAIDVLRDKNVVFEKDGALWLRSTDFGDDKDRVLIKSNGEAAYLSGDVAYYLDKRLRGADNAIYLLGADHHGYIGRMMAVCAAFGDVPGENMQIIIGQLVSLLRDGEPVRMSKRAGTVVTLDDLVDAVGVDASRYSLVRVSADTPLTIDLDLLASRSNENPVYYVQYAHARTRSVARNAEEHGVHMGETYDPSQLDHPADEELIAALARFPEVVAQAADLREVHRIARYLESLASTYHAWYSQCRVTPRADEEVTDAHTARLWLNEATSQVLRSGLDLLGVTAPEQM